MTGSPSIDESPRTVAVGGMHEATVGEQRRGAGHQLDPRVVVVVRSTVVVATGRAVADVDAQHHRTLLVA